MEVAHMKFKVPLSSALFMLSPLRLCLHNATGVDRNFSSGHSLHSQYFFPSTLVGVYLMLFFLLTSGWNNSNINLIFCYYTVSLSLNIVLILFSLCFVLNLYQCFPSCWHFSKHLFMRIWSSYDSIVSSICLWKAKAFFLRITLKKFLL